MGKGSATRASREQSYTGKGSFLETGETMVVLWLVSWVGLAGQLLFVVFSLEIIEEYSILAKKIITCLLAFVLLVYVCLLLDGFPVGLVVTGILCHLCYGSLLSTFPVISLLSPGFIVGTLFFLVGHYLAFQHFAEEWHAFQELLAFFFLCLWMVPFSFFISLSANDLALPTLGGMAGNDTGGASRKRRSGFLALVDFMSNKIGTVTPSKTSKSW